MTTDIERSVDGATDHARNTDGLRWWQNAVVYQVYLRSFADSDGDGTGDIEGLRSRLPYLVDLGVDALWITPWYPSPLADGGYDVSDYRDIHPDFGTLADAERLVREAHDAGVRIIIDMVANHTSEQHPWFRAALAAGPGSPERERFYFRDGRGPGGTEPPNDWVSAFGGSAWTRTTERDDAPGQWYLHLFAPEQPDLNWRHAAVREEFEDILRFWLDRGVDGIRVDAVPAMAKVPGLPDAGLAPGAAFESSTWVDNPHWDVDDVHEIMRAWRTVIDEYGPDRMFVAEAVVNGPERLARYVRPDELHTAFNFDFVRAGWDATRLRNAIDDCLATFGPVGAPASWVLSSHDETRHVTRFGRADTRAVTMAFDTRTDVVDLDLGTRRARAAALLELALPGIAYVYQGDELALPEVTDLPDEVLRDPTWERSGHTSRGRDGCRVPLPWSGTRPPFGFSPSDAVPWLPQPAEWKELTADRAARDPASMLTLYRAALRLRHSEPDLRALDFAWLPSDDGVLMFRRGGGIVCVVNLSGSDIALPPGEMLLASVDLDAGRLPSDAAVWLCLGTRERAEL